MTNFDRIQNMSVDEMALVIFESDLSNMGVNCELHCAYAVNGKCYKTNNVGTCIDGIEKWLLSEVADNE